ncbi:MAG: hypothetical protein Q9187_003044 [Circinaria calcarea]
MSGEFVGTFMFLFFAFSGTQVANTKSPGATVIDAPDLVQLLYISLCFGFSLAVNAWVMFRISGGLFNPAVTLGMCLVGVIPWVRGALSVVSQLLGAIASAAAVSATFPGSLNVRTSLGGGTTVARGLFIEMFLTAQLVFTIFMLAAEKHKATFIAPVGIGLSLFIAELTGVYYTGGRADSAKVGPILGSLLASGFYIFIKMLEYETANPGQDKDDTEPRVLAPGQDRPRPRVSFAPEEPQSPPNGHDGETVDRDVVEDSNRHIVSNRSQSVLDWLGRPQMSALRGGRTGPTYPPVEGAANYTTRNTRLAESFNTAPVAEAGRILPRSAGHA